jgi:hypothetical protein
MRGQCALLVPDMLWAWCTDGPPQLLSAPDGWDSDATADTPDTPGTPGGTVRARAAASSGEGMHGDRQGLGAACGPHAWRGAARLVFWSGRRAADEHRVQPGWG